MGEWLYRSMFFFTSAMVLGEWSASRPGRFTRGKEQQDIRWIGDWMEPWTCLDDMKKENSWPYRGSSFDFSVIQPVSSRYADCALSAPT
jgi:hypothetical protein